MARVSEQSCIGMSLFFFSCCLYSNTLRAGFTFDDNFAVVNNKDVTDPHGSWWRLLRHDFWGQDLASEQSHKSYRPVTTASFRLQRIVGSWLPHGKTGSRKLGLGEDNAGGVDPLPFHATNILLHAGVVVLVHKLTLLLLRWRSTTSTDNRARAEWEAGLAAALFACHPVHTEAVAGVVGQAELWCAAFSISALLAYLKAADERRVAESRWRWLGVALLQVWCASLAKEIGITMVGCMLLLEVVTWFGHSDCPGGSDKGGGLLPHPSSLIRCTSLLATAGCYIALRSWLAVDQLVSIYRKVENPIPFAASPLTRGLTTAYLHARYAGLLVLPIQLSADWSFECIPLVTDVQDPRNAASVALYSSLAWLAVAARPWRWCNRAGDCFDAKNLAQQQYRVVIVLGLLVAPFLPASNILFYVGTFIGERLLYLPSLGFCLLAANILTGLLLSTLAVAANKKPRLKGSVLLATVTLLLAFSAKTWSRNWEWRDEETLFIAAQKVCSNSAKVQLNSGILERRHQRWGPALRHFQRARQIEPGYCEPAYWIGVTLASQGQVAAAVKELQVALQCKYVAVDALQALAAIFQQLLERDPGNADVAVAWARILRAPPLEQVEEGCDILERTSSASGRLDHLEECFSSLEASKQPQLSQVGRCIEERWRMRQVAAGVGLKSREGKQGLYTYLSSMAPVCRMKQGGGGDRVAGGHLEAVHAWQQGDPEDPWLQLEWGELLVALGRREEAARHFQAAGLLLSSWLGAAGMGEGQPGIHPVSQSVELLGPQAIAASALQALQAASQIQGGERCRSLRAACDMRLQLLDLMQRGPTDGLMDQSYSYSDLLEGARECKVEYTATCGGGW